MNITSKNSSCTFDLIESTKVYLEDCLNHKVPDKLKGGCKLSSRVINSLIFEKVFEFVSQGYSSFCIHEEKNGCSLSGVKNGFNSEVIYIPLASDMNEIYIKKITQFIFKDRIYAVSQRTPNSIVFDIFRRVNGENINPKTYQQVVNSALVGTGLLVITGKKNSGYLNMTNQVVSSLSSKVGEFAVISKYGDEFVISGVKGSVTFKDVKEVMYYLSSSYRDRIQVNACEDTSLLKLGIELSELGFFVVVSLSSQSSVHCYSMLLRNFSPTLLAGVLVGVMGVAIVPEVVSKGVKTVVFKDDSRFPYYGKLDSSPPADDKVLLYSKSNLDERLISGCFTLVDYIEKPRDLIELSSSAPSVADFYSQLKLHGWSGNLDNAMLLVRNKQTSIDLVDRFIGKY